jgi:hypothetical protein
VLVRARSVEVGSRAVIGGDVVFETLNEPQIEPGATLQGRQTVTLPRPGPRDGWGIAQALGTIVLFGLGAGVLAGVILLAVGPRFIEDAVARMRAAPGGSLLAGLGVFVLVPLAAFLLMVTVIGLPIGLVMLLALPLLWLTASVMAAFGLADWLLNRPRREASLTMRLVQLLVGVVVLTLIGLIPVVGPLVWLIALLLGLGATWRVLRLRLAPAAV